MTSILTHFATLILGALFGGVAVAMIMTGAKADEDEPPMGI